jgi:hypothetical protein
VSVQVLELLPVEVQVDKLELMLVPELVLVQGQELVLC